MRKLIWVALGAAVIGLTALIIRRSRAAGGLTPKGLAASASAAVSDLTAGVQGFAADVRQGMAEHEATLREAAELDGGHLGPAGTT